MWGGVCGVGCVPLGGLTFGRIPALIPNATPYVNDADPVVSGDG